MSNQTKIAVTPVRPDDIINDSQNYAYFKGVKVRKGTIAAAIQNAKVLTCETASLSEKAEARKIIKELAPALVALDVYDQLVWKNKEVQQIIETTAQQINLT